MIRLYKKFVFINGKLMAVLFLQLSNAREAASTAETKVKKLSQLNGNLERENKVLNDEVENLKKDIKRKMQQMEEDAEER